MTRRRRPGPAKKKGGLLVGMRSGVQHMAGAGKAHAHADEAAAPPTRGKRIWNIIGNVVTVIAILAAAAIMLRRCGVLQF